MTERLWHIISFWTKAQDVEFNDGTNAQSKLGNIAGISDSLTSTASNVAASAAAVKALNDKIVNQIDNLNGQISNKNNQINDLNSQITDKNAGFDRIFDALVDKGQTPASKNPGDLVSAIGNISANLDAQIVNSESGDIQIEAGHIYLYTTSHSSGGMATYVYSDLNEPHWIAASPKAETELIVSAQSEAKDSENNFLRGTVQIVRCLKTGYIGNRNGIVVKLA